MSKAIENLLKIKSLVTLAVIAVFSTLSIRGDVQPDQVMNVVLMVIAFYFGTQHQKKGGVSDGS